MLGLSPGLLQLLVSRSNHSVRSHPDAVFKKKNGVRDSMPELTITAQFHSRLRSPALHLNNDEYQLMFSQLSTNRRRESAMKGEGHCCQGRKFCQKAQMWPKKKWGGSINWWPKFDIILPKVAEENFQPICYLFKNLLKYEEPIGYFDIIFLTIGRTVPKRDITFWCDGPET